MLKRILIFLIMILILVGCFGSYQTSEIRGVWVSYIDYTQILWGKNQTEFEQEVDLILKNCNEYEINTIYLHASAFTDAYYDSEIYPTQYIGASIGEELSFDPLKVFVEKAHAQQIRVEAWINPFRSFDEKKMSQVPDHFIVKQWVNSNSRNVVYYKDRYYLNPAYQEVHDLILNVVEELIDNYEIDGIHMDDYFYPDHVQDSFDEMDYLKTDQALSIENWRRQNVNELVKNIHKKIKQMDSDLTFGISPAGNLEYSRDSIFGDVETWVKEEWMDYIAPQIYFGYTNKSRPYSETLAQWSEVVKGTDVDLIAGLGAYKVNQINGNSDDEEWVNDHEILIKQIEEAKQKENYKGYALYSYQSMFRGESEDVEAVMHQLEQIAEMAGK